MNKRVLNHLRCRLNDDRVEKQVSVAHNWAQLDRDFCRKRSAFEGYIARLRQSASNQNVSGTCQDETSEMGFTAHDSESSSLQGISNPLDYDDGDDFEPVISVEKVELEHNVWDFAVPSAIIDSVLFNDPSDRNDDSVFS